MKNKSLRYLTVAAMTAALYAVLCLVLAPISYSAIQVRVAEALTILPVFTPAAIPGLTIGCLLANILGGCPLLDIVFGTLATLIGAVGTYLLRSRKYLIWLPPVVSNTILVSIFSIYLPFSKESDDSLWFIMLTVGIGELISVCVLGYLLYFAVKKLVSGSVLQMIR
ncbi:MAG: QueT transporter family protein [Lachnospiraceae bacterium]|nr:QueT transporter family protein [Lachnospiraceae bacterium]